MYQAEASEIRRRGGNVRRVILDYEFKREVYKPLAQARHLPKEEFTRIQDEVARQNGLQVLQARIPLRDLRIEYETSDGELSKVDLELATEHYKGSQLASKLRAGFKVYIAGSTSGRGGVVRDERELTAGNLSL